MTKKELAKYIDHTQLAACATKADIEKLCAEAREYDFASVCVNPVFIPLAAELLKGSDVKVCTVIDFPLGASGRESKNMQASAAIRDGADELDFVISLSLVKAHKWEELADELKALEDAAKKEKPSILTKLILETCYLTDEEIVESCKAAKKGGFDFVKTSTGFATPKDSSGKSLPNGATVHAVELMRKTVGDSMGVKASGGIHNFEECMAMIEAGASRIGASAGVKILAGANLA